MVNGNRKGGFGTLLFHENGVAEKINDPSSTVLHVARLTITLYYNYYY
jgi:hypothetical protein